LLSDRLTPPSGEVTEIVSVWITEGPVLRLVTAYPAKEATP
jgi:hypothetical protein